jgi:hypothetical protein
MNLLLDGISMGRGLCALEHPGAASNCP